MMTIMIKQFTLESFQKHLKDKSKQKISIVLFLPTTLLSKLEEQYVNLFTKLSDSFKDYKFYTMSLDLLPEDQQCKYAVSNVPTIHIFDSKDKVIAYAGFTLPSLDLFNKFLDKNCPLA